MFFSLSTKSKPFQSFSSAWKHAFSTEIMFVSKLFHIKSFLSSKTNTRKDKTWTVSQLEHFFVLSYFLCFPLHASAKSMWIVRRGWRYKKCYICYECVRNCLIQVCLENVMFVFSPRKKLVEIELHGRSGKKRNKTLQK